MDDLSDRQGLCIHQQLHILRNAARNGIESQQVVVRVAGGVLREDLLQHRQCERREFHDDIRPPEQRFVVVLEDLDHQRIDRAADDEVHMGLQPVLIPDILHVAVDRGVDVEELLEFIHNQRESAALSLLHQEGEDILKARHGRDEEPQFRRNLLAVARAKRCLVLAPDEEVDQRFVFHRPENQRCLADPAAARQNGQSRMVFV